MDGRSAARRRRRVVAGRLTPGIAAVTFAVLSAGTTLVVRLGVIGAAAAGAQCGFTALPPCPYIQDVSPRLIDQDSRVQLTLRGGALDAVTSVSLEPVGRSLRYTVVDPQTMTITFPGNVPAGSYTIRIAGLGVSQDSATLAVVPPGPPTTPYSSAVIPVATPSPTDSPSPSPQTTPAPVPAAATGTPSGDGSRTMVIASESAFALLIFIVLFIRLVLIWLRRRPEKIEKALARLWSLDNSGPPTEPPSPM